MCYGAAASAVAGKASSAVASKASSAAGKAAGQAAGKAAAQAIKGALQKGRNKSGDGPGTIAAARKRRGE